MAKSVLNGASLLCRTLEQLGVTSIFTVSGTQTLHILEALRRSSIRTTQTTSELAASFMANGYFRNCGMPGVMIAIPGPGFVCSLTGVAEAYLDSAAMLLISVVRVYQDNKRFQLQKIDQASMIRPIVKSMVRIDRVSDLQAKLTGAFFSSQAGEPGPVYVEIDDHVLTETSAREASPLPPRAEIDPTIIHNVRERLLACKRVVFFAGQGANQASNFLCKLAEWLRAPVLTTTSARGVIPENHPLAFPYSHFKGGGETVNRMFDVCDLILAVGCKFSHNGSGGFSLRLPPEKLIHVDSSKEVLGANYPAHVQIQCDAAIFLESLLKHLKEENCTGCGWEERELNTWRKKAEGEARKLKLQPRLEGIKGGKVERFFSWLAELMPADCCVVTDSGLHQYMVRKYYSVRSPRGLIVPSDFQSMGYGIPAAIGARLANPARPVVAIVGDGGFLMSGMEISTALREGVDLTIVVFSDGYHGLIRSQQFVHFGYSYATAIKTPDFALFAKAFGINYCRLTDESKDEFGAMLSNGGVNLVEIELSDTPEVRSVRSKAVAKKYIKGVMRIS